MERVEAGVGLQIFIRQLIDQRWHIMEFVHCVSQELYLERSLGQKSLWETLILIIVRRDLRADIYSESEQL